MMLGINTATDKTEIALTDGTAVVFEKSWKSAYNEAEKLFPALKIVLAKLKGKKPDRIFVVEGPGAFTGLRIGVTVANTLAFYFGVTIVAMNTFDFVEQKLTAARKKDTIILMKAGGGHLAAKIPRSKKIHRLRTEDMPDFLKKHTAIRYSAGDPELCPKGLKKVPMSGMKTLGEVMPALPERIKSHKLIKPFYLNPPHITKSKKPSFT